MLGVFRVLTYFLFCLYTCLLPGTDEVHRKIRRKVDLWRIHFACNSKTMKEGCEQICELMSMMIVDIDAVDGNTEHTTNKHNSKSIKQRVLDVYELCLPILRECWSSSICCDQHLANCYCRAVYVLAHSNHKKDDGSAHNRSNYSAPKKSSYLTRLVRREDLSIAQEVTRLSTDMGKFKRWRQLSSSLVEMTSIVPLRTSLIQFNITPLMLSLVQQSDEQLKQLVVTVKSETTKNGAGEQSTSWEQSLLCKQTSESIAQVIFNLSISKSTRKWLIGKAYCLLRYCMSEMKGKEMAYTLFLYHFVTIVFVFASLTTTGKGMLMSLKRLTHSFHTSKCLCLVAQTIEFYCEDRNAARLGVKEGLIHIVDCIMETVYSMRTTLNKSTKALRIALYAMDENDKTRQPMPQQIQANNKEDQYLVAINEIATRCLVTICSHEILTPLNQILEICTTALDPNCSVEKINGCVKSLAYFSDSKQVQLKEEFYKQSFLIKALWSLSLKDDAPMINERVARLLSCISKEIDTIERCREIFASNEYYRILQNVQERSTTAISKSCCLNVTVRLKMYANANEKVKKVMIYQNAAFLEK